ncbi:MAG: hypothetical protein PUE72_10260 [Lachnospiraceae bacterium]|nr:hypothetical protein [Lachnospiraceae bacterium]
MESMPEYRRFIAYFYEYIDGKKTSNVGFAKVELRSGMWRILFRLTAVHSPEPPVQVYGFVREKGYLLGLLMGTMRSGNQMLEEWAYHAGNEVWKKQYGFSDLAGIWIQCGDGRRYVTVWDDDPIEINRFVLELPDEGKVEQGETGADSETWKMQQGETGTDSESWKMQQGESGTDSETKEDKNGGKDSGEPISENANVQSEHAEEISEKSEEEKQYAGATAKEPEEKDYSGISVKKVEREIRSGREENIKRQEVYSSGTTSEARKEAAAAGGALAYVEAAQLAEDGIYTELNRRSVPSPCDAITQRREAFEPFEDTQFEACFKILPCDLVALQQAGYQVGRSSFLLHGFYQYHHLLLARRADGSFVLGVPGLYNAQERYMAQTFGFPDFKTAKWKDRGRQFGYYYRIL